MEELLNLFDELSELLAQLAELGRKKIEVVNQDDLLALNDIMKQEQVHALKARGLENTRQQLSERFGLQGVSLDDTPGKFPPELRKRANETVDRLHREYQMYSAASVTARNILEANMHEIEKFLADAGVDPVSGPGYDPGTIEPPSKMKTDFRA